MSVVAHSIINSDNANSLFRGMIISSGFRKRQIHQGARRVRYCRQPGSLQCLRALSVDERLKAGSSLSMEFRWRGGNYPYTPQPDDSDSFYPVAGDAAISSSKYANVPIITGDSEDKYTLFALT